jgi:hypothetical protein
VLRSRSWNFLTPETEIIELSNEIMELFKEYSYRREIMK